MKINYLLILFLFLTLQSRAQLYFPPTSGTAWDTLSPSSLGWCQDKIDSLYQYLDSKHSKAFILLKDGKIVLEKYFDTHTQNAVWYWASAGKTLTAMAVGIAQQQGYLSIQDTTSHYLGNGWTSLPLVDEQKIRIQDQLQMTSGLDDGVVDPYCTLSACLVYKATPSSRWAYHNAPYTLLDSVIAMATGQTLNAFVTQKIKSITGMDGLFVQSGYNHVFYSTARSMARYGLLLLNKGIWNQTPVLNDSVYFHSMTHSSQTLNPSYGYLTWLNGQSSFMVPQSQLQFNGWLNPDAPADMFAAMGKNAQFINVVPSMNMVWIRMGEAPDSSQVPFLMNDTIWTKLNQLTCFPAYQEQVQSEINAAIFPNPSHDVLSILLPTRVFTQHKKTQYRIHDCIGRTWLKGNFTNNPNTLNLSEIPNGIYWVEIITPEERWVKRLIKQ